MLAKILILAAFFIITVAVGLIFSKKANSVGGFVLGGRGIGPWLSAFAYGTSYFSAVVFVGYAGQFGYNYGIAATWVGIGNALIGSLAAWVVLGRRTRVMTKHLDSATMPDFFAKRFRCGGLKTAASVLIFVFLIPYSASVYKGLSQLFALAFDVDFTYCIIGIAVLTTIYVVLGGYFATAVNDFIQGIIMLIGIIAVVAAVLNGKGGFTEAVNQLSQVPSDLQPGLNGALTSFFGPEPLNLLGIVILTSLGTWGLPQMIHKFYTIKNEQSIRTGTIISTIFAFIVAGGSYFMGGFGRLYYTAEGAVNYDMIVPQMLSQSLSDLLIGVVIVLVLSASMSTLSSLVITSSATFVSDLCKGSFAKNMKSRTEITLIRVMCAVFIAISVLIALNPSSLITTLMSLSWGVLAGAFLGPFLYGLFWKRATRASVWAGFLIGTAIPVINLFVNFTTPTNAGALSIVSSLIVVPVFSLLSPKPDPVHVEAVFSCYDKPVMAKSRKVLDETDEH